jgi:peptidoglycan/LPS O-acetylase OafA/YrhL
LSVNAASRGEARRVASLDLLRGVAAFSVAIPHYFLIGADARPHWEAAAVVAVEIFFVLSGFVLGPQIVDCVRNGFGDLRIFLVRRWMRTIPPYLFALVIVSLAGGTLFSTDFWRYTFYVENFAGQHNVADYYPVAWSLSIEEWFYISFPLVLLGFVRVTGSRSIRQVVLIAMLYMAIVSAARFWFGVTADWGADVRRVVIFRVDSIAYGFLLYVALERAVVVGGSIPWSALAFAACAAVAYGVTLAIPGHSDYAEFFPFCAAACGISAIVFFRALEPVLQHHSWIARFCYFAGRISYSMYLFHLLIAVGLHRVLGRLPLLLQLAIYLSCCVAASSLFFRYFERPILAARPRYASARARQPMELPVPAQ